jgi:NAD(P)H dehydrogenase (quinone)
MGKVLVLHDSKTGHTQQMAGYVAEGAEAVPGMEVRLRSVDEATKDDVLWCDGLAVGSPTNLATVSWRMKRFWDELSDELWGQVDGKIACAFSSSGGWGGGSELTCLSLLVLLMNFGFLTFGVTDYVANQFTLHYGAITAGKPQRDEEIAACRRLGQRLAQWVAVYVDGRHDLHPGPIERRS